MFLVKPAASVDIYNDEDKELVNFFRVLREKKLFLELQRGLDNTLYSREEFDLAHEACLDRVERARRFVVRHWQGEADAWRYSVDKANRGRANVIAQWEGAVKSLVSIHRRMRGVQVERDSWRVILKRYDKPTTLFFVDRCYHPTSEQEPLLGGVRGQEEEGFLQDYERLVQAVLSTKGMVAFRAHGQEPESRLQEAGWEKRSFTRDVAQGLWLCPKAVRSINAAKNDNRQRPLFL